MLFVNREMERANLGIEPWTLITAAIIVLDYFFQRRETAVMHVGRGAGNFTECGRFEVAAAGSSIDELPV